MVVCITAHQTYEDGIDLTSLNKLGLASCLQWLIHLFKTSCYLSKVWRTTISVRFLECIVRLCFPQRFSAKSYLDAMEKPVHKTDCFLQVSSTVSTRCNQDHMPEDERIHGSTSILVFDASYSLQHLAAISMTLCELATANYQSPPLECASFTLEAQAAGMVTTHRLQRDCVECLWVGSHGTYT
jgi:hypothetical protein